MIPIIYTCRERKIYGGTEYIIEDSFGNLVDIIEDDFQEVESVLRYLNRPHKVDGKSSSGM